MNSRRLIFIAKDSSNFSELKHQTGNNTPASIRARPAVQRENESDSRTRLHPPNGLKVEAESSVTQQGVVTGTFLVQLRLPNQFEKRDDLQHLRQRQLFVCDCVSEHKAVFKRLRTACIAGTKQ